MKKIIDLQTKFQWRISPPKTDSGSYVGICDRLNITAEASTMNELIDILQNNMRMLFLDLWEEKEFNKFAWDHSVEYKITEEDGFLYVSPGPIWVE